MSKLSRKSKDSPFAALAKVKARPAAPVRRAAPVAEVDEDGAKLFLASLRDVKPLSPSGLAEIARPRPAAVPRPRSKETEVESRPAPPPDPRDPQALWRSAYQDVIPLADSGRVDLGSAAHRKPLVDAMAHLETAPPMDLPKDPLELFRYLMRGTQPLPETGKLHLAPPPPAAIPRQKAKNEKEVLRESLEAPLSFEDRLDMGDEVAFLRPGLPRRVLMDLRRGRWVTQGELDLHGMDRDAAREALGQFIAASLQFGRRCVRLIHGKGLGSPGREPVLKHLSKSWLSQRDEVLAFCQAKPHDGGEGALLILLKAGQVVKREK